MQRFFIETGSQHHLVSGELLPLPNRLAHQVRDVLHLSVGEELVLLDNSGDEIHCTLKSSSKTIVTVLVGERQAGKSESPVRVILCQALLKSARFEWILEKGTELGVAAFAPILCRRSMTGLESAGQTKIQRWQRIIEEATEQCGRARRPELFPIRPLARALSAIPAGAISLMAWEEEQGQSLHQALQSHPHVEEGLAPASTHALDAHHIGVGLAPVRVQPQPITVVLFIGPEGGLLKEEIQLAQQHGVQSVTLGTRILRAETAALAAVANVMYELEARCKDKNHLM